jgi:extradiol dioxygenase family protein
MSFYHEVIGCPIKRSNESSFTIDFFGHGISFEYIKEFAGLGKWLSCSSVDVDHRQYVPSMHWGINLDSLELFNEILERVKAAKLEFVVPATRYNVGKSNEQALFFVKDPTGYVLEFRYMAKAFKLNELEQWDQRSEGHERKSL